MITIGNLYVDGDNDTLKRYAVTRTINEDCENYDVWEPLLAPSASLLNLYLKLKENGQWNKETFQHYYVPNFLYEMKNKKKRNKLTNIYYEGLYTDLILLCHCSNEELCHRSILAGLLQGAAKENGVNLVSCNKDYSKYYKMFREG